MGQYQFFRMDRLGARGEAVSVSLADDVTAIRQALSGEYRDGCELWDGFRFIGRFYGPDACRAPDAVLAEPAEPIETAFELDPPATPRKALVH
jgi:hypothetical protein